jgi:hypothetical protein
LFFVPCYVTGVPASIIVLIKSNLTEPGKKGKGIKVKTKNEKLKIKNEKDSPKGAAFFY